MGSVSTSKVSASKQTARRARSRTMCRSTCTIFHAGLCMKARPLVVFIVGPGISRASTRPSIRRLENCLRRPRGLKGPPPTEARELRDMIRGSVREVLAILRARHRSLGGNIPCAEVGAGLDRSGNPVTTGASPTQTAKNGLRITRYRRRSVSSARACREHQDETSSTMVEDWRTIRAC